MNIRGIVKPFRLRGCDKAGCGNFGAERHRFIDGIRKKYKHEGLDIKTSVGSPVFAPFDLQFIRIARPYSDDNILSGAKYAFENGTLKIFYLKPITDKVRFSKGEKIGTAQNIADKWGKGMKNHIHLEIRNKERKLTNPELYI